MAEAIAKSILHKIASSTEINPPKSIKKDLKKIADSITASCELLADESVHAEESYTFKLWVQNLERVFYDIEDLLDEMAFDVLQRRVKRGGYLRLQGLQNFNERGKIKGLRMKLDDIVANANCFNLNKRPAKHSTVDIRDPFDVSSYVYEPNDIIGREEDMNDIIKGFISVNDASELSVFSIVGIGGIGKTTLAKLVYHRVQHFDLKFWVNVSQNLNMSKIIKGILNDGTSNQDTDILVEKLHNLLRGNKYLLVLDDVWLEDREKWFQLKEVLAVGNAGSVLLITTRSMEEARRCGAIKYSHNEPNTCLLQPLPMDVRWSLFTQLAFKKGEEDMYPALCQIGKFIIMKCCGIPLPIKVIASLLRNQREERKWEQYSDIFEKSYDGVFEVLKFSYHQLLCDLKPCFASMSFVKDKNVSTDYVPYIWSALGLLPIDNKNKDIEGLGYSYLMELVSKSLIENPSIHFTGIYLQSEMHHLLRDLALNRLGAELAIVNWDNVDERIFGDFVRHIVLEDGIHDRGNDSENIEIYTRFFGGKKVRSLQFNLETNQRVSHSFLEHIISNFSYLRVLEFGKLWFEELPRSIKNLKHLRYLDMSGNPIIRSLPNSICELLNLETFCIHGCENLKGLPKKVHQLQNLKKFRVTCQVNLIGSSFSELSSLQFLSFDSCKSMTSMWEKVGSLTSLRTLCINDCPKLTNLPNSMKSLENLQKLHIQNCEELDLNKGEGLQGLQSLRYLFINNLKLSSLPNGIQSAAVSLQHLIIRDCRGLVELPDWLYNFTSLLTINIINCPNLLCLPESICAITSLQKLAIKGCPHLSKRYDKRCGEDWPLIQHIPSVELDEIGFILNQTAGTASLNDEVWHLCHIERNGIIHTRLKEAKINSVKDLYLLYHVDANSLLKEILQVSEKEFQEIVEHATSYLNMKQPEYASGADKIEQPVYASGSYKGKEVIGDNSLQTMEQPLDVAAETSGVSKEDDNYIKCKSMMLFCLLLGENHEFEREKIIQLSMAAGVIKKEPLEDNGDRIFNILLEKEYILPSSNAILRQNSLYKVNPEKISDVFDGVDRTEVFKMRIGDDNFMANQLADSWHVSVQSSNINHAFESLKKLSMVKTLLLLNGSLLTRVPPDFFTTFKSLTTLDLSDNCITELPSSIHHAEELCYVDLSRSPIERLPQSIVQLRKLQTLRLKGCTDLYELPEKMMELINLRHLVFDVLSQLSVMPRGIGHLTKLQTLLAFIVDGEIVDGEKRCNIIELKLMNNLCGTLCISGLEHASSQDAEEASLIDKKCLKHLELRWGDNSECLPMEELLRLIQCLQPHSDLEELKIVCYPGECLPDWIEDPQYERLVSITLYKCENCSEFPCFGRLPQLNNLEIFEMNGVKEIDHAFYGDDKDDVAYLALKKLSINGMCSVEEWKGLRDGDFPCLVKLFITRCPNLVSLSSFPRCQSLKHLEIMDCSLLKCLPEEMLSSPLDDLVIDDCPFLRKTYSKGGENSHKIEHVKNVWIDSEEEESSNGHSTEDDDSIDGSHSEVDLNGDDLSHNF